MKRYIRTDKIVSDPVGLALIAGHQSIWEFLYMMQAQSVNELKDRINGQAERVEKRLDYYAVELYGYTHHNCEVLRLVLKAFVQSGIAVETTRKWPLRRPES